MLTTKQAAQRLGVGPQWIRDLIKEGRLEAERFGNAWMIKSSDLDKLEFKKRRHVRK